MSNEIAAKQHAKEAEMSKNIHDFLRSNDLIKSFVFDEGDYDEQTLALVKMQVLDDNGKVVDGVYTILINDYLSNLQTNLNMRFAGIYNVKDDVLYISAKNEYANHLDILTQEDFDTWVTEIGAIATKFDLTLRKKAKQRAAEMFKQGKWMKDLSKDELKLLVIKRQVKEMTHTELTNKHSALKVYFGEYYEPSDRLLAVASVDESYIDSYVERLMNENTSFALEELKELIYQDLKDNIKFSFDEERNLNMFSVMNLEHNDNKIKTSSMLDIVYTDKHNKTKSENNINPEVFRRYFETVSLSDLVNYNVHTLPTDKADRLWKTMIDVSDIQAIILNGETIWTRYKN